MAFVNEYIPEADYVKYGLRELDWGERLPGLRGSRIATDSWTIDRDRDIYLRKFSAGRELDDCSTLGWTCWWHGDLLWFLEEGIEFRGERNGPQWSHFRLTKLHIPAHLKPHQDEILNDIREAFQTYAGGGVFSTATEYSQQIDFVLE